MSFEWVESDTTDLETFIKILLGVGVMATGLSFATEGLFSVDVVGEYILAVLLNVLVIPISILELGDQIGFPELFQFGFLEWNVIVLMWVFVGWNLSDALFRAVGVINTPMPEPSLSAIVSSAGVGILAGGIVESAIGGGVQTVGKVWLAITFNVGLLPTFIMSDIYNWQLTEWLAVLGAVLVTGLAFGLVSYVVGDDDATPSPMSLF